VPTDDPDSDRNAPVDVDELVHELKERVATSTHQGSEEGDLGGSPLHPAVPAPPQPPRLRDEVIISRRPVIGPIITLARRIAMRLVPVEGLIQQAVEAAQGGLAAEADARERVERDLRQLAKRVSELAAIADPLTGLEGSLDQLEVGQRLIAHEQRLLADELRRRVEAAHAMIERLSVGPRLARLERESEVQATSTPSAPRPSPPVSDALDYYAFEARFRPEEAVRERQQIYVEILRGLDPVVDLGCGRGELVELLGQAGTRAYGVDVNADFIAAGAERGVEILREDAVGHLESVDPGSLGAVVASHLIEHLPGETVAYLVKLAFDRLRTGGVLVLETPNPESLIAGSVNFHRDLTHLRPIHPETLEFVCSAVGFGRVEIRRLSPTPEAELLPTVRREVGPLAGDLNTVIDALNERLYGYQDYAVIAWK
jgi:SAM-dependent methyltransferase